MFPMLGLFLFFIPAAGLVAGIGLCCARPVRFLAPFALLIPLFGGYCAVAGFFGLGILVERLGFTHWPAGLIVTLIGLLGGGAFGCFLGAALGVGVLWTIRSLKRRLRQLQSS